ncbi:recombinase family protein [Bengtsoniella intestinalis]
MTRDIVEVFLRGGRVASHPTQRYYCGDVINFKTYSKSYKNKKRLPNDDENMAVFRDVHEPIIERATFEMVQTKRGSIRKRKTLDGERTVFGILGLCGLWAQPPLPLQPAE